MSQLLPNRPAYQQLVGKQQVCKSVQGNRRCAQATLVPRTCPARVMLDFWGLRQAVTCGVRREGLGLGVCVWRARREQTAIEAIAA